MKKRKFLAGLLMASALVGLASCGGNPTPAETSTNTPAGTTTTQAPATSTSAAAAGTSSATVERALTGLQIPSGSTHRTKYELIDGEDTFSTAGLKVNAVYNVVPKVENVNISEATITLSKSGAEVELTNNKFTEAGTYTVTVAYSGKTTTYDVVVKNEQYKNSSEITLTQAIEENGTIVDDYHGKIVADGTVGHTENDKDVSYNGQKVDMLKSIKIKQGFGTIKVTAKSDCMLKVLGTAAKNMNFQCINDADSTDKQDGIMMNPEGADDQTKMTSVIHVDTFNLKRGVTYTITNASTAGSAYIYGLEFAYEVDKDSVVTDYLDLSKEKVVEFYLTGENTLNLAAPQGLTVKKVNTCGFAEVSTNHTIAVTKKGETEALTTITEAGEYTITVSVDGKSASYDVTVVDSTQPLTAISATATTTVFYGTAPTVADLGTLTVIGTRGGNNVAIEAANYTITLINADNTDAATFAAAGKYRAKITSEGVDGFIDIYYETVENVNFNVSGAKTQVKTGSTSYTSGVTAKATYTNTANATEAKVVDAEVTVVGYYSDAECATPIADATTAFAADGKVYVKLAAAGSNKVIEVTVVNIVEYDVKFKASDLTTGDTGVAADDAKGIAFVEDKSEEKATCTPAELCNGFFAQTASKVMKRSGQFKNNGTTNYNSACSAIETSQNVGLKFTIESAATLSLSLQSTGSKNSSAFVLVKVVGDTRTTVAATTTGLTAATPTGLQTTGFAFDANTYEITGSKVDIEYANLEAGTYEMLFIADKDGTDDAGTSKTAKYGRGGRFLEIKVSNKAEQLK